MRSNLELCPEGCGRNMLKGRDRCSHCDRELNRIGPEERVAVLSWACFMHKVGYVHWILGLHHFPGLEPTSRQRERWAWQETHSAARATALLRGLSPGYAERLARRAVGL